MGLAPGGRMKQEVYDDPYGLDAWDQRHFSRCFVTIANSITWHAITGERPPDAAADRGRLRQCRPAVVRLLRCRRQGARRLGQLAKTKSVVEMATSKGEEPLPENASAEIEHIIRLRKRRPAVVREAAF